MMIKKLYHNNCDIHALLFRLEFPSVLILYQDIIMSVHGVMVLIGFMDRRLFCTSSDDLLESYDSPSAFSTASGE